VVIVDGDSGSRLPVAPPLRDLNRHVGGTNTLATTSFVLSFLTFGCALVGPVSIVMGHVARVQIKRYGEEGGGLALAALTIAYVGLAFWTFMAILIRSSA
jgi:hypothetical protein